MNGSGIRDPSRVLGVSVTTVIAHLKKLKPVNVNPQPIQWYTLRLNYSVKRMNSSLM